MSGFFFESFAFPDRFFSAFSSKTSSDEITCDKKNPSFLSEPNEEVAPIRVERQLQGRRYTQQNMSAGLTD
jgi:hypothetical protein